MKFYDDRCKGKAVMRWKPKCGRQTDGRTDMVIPESPPLTSLGGGGGIITVETNGPQKNYGYVCSLTLTFEI